MRNQEAFHQQSSMDSPTSLSITNPKADIEIGECYDDYLNFKMENNDYKQNKKMKELSKLN